MLFEGLHYGSPHLKYCTVVCQIFVMQVTFFYIGQLGGIASY